MVLRRLSYPCTLKDLRLIFYRDEGDISKFIKQGINLIFDTWKQLLKWNERYLTTEKLLEFSSIIAEKGAALSNCVGFIDETVQAICRPKKNQKLVFNGHKRIHALKYQCVVTPDCMITDINGPWNGARHDSGIFTDSGLHEILEKNLNFENFSFCIYGDTAYGIRTHLQAPFKGNNLSNSKKEFNDSMSKVRIAVEWTFGKMSKTYDFNDYKKNLRLYSQPSENIFWLQHF
jgi:hypothetical protein